MNTKITEKIGKFVDDITTLDVLTLSGNIALTPGAASSTTPTAGGTTAGAGGTAAPAAPTAMKELDWDTYFASVIAKLKSTSNDSKLEIVAYTHTELDADSVNYYRATEADGDDDSLRDLHIRTVESATKARLEAIAAFARVFKK